MTNLKRSIVIVNEFSVPLPGGKGTMGATPGKYAYRYTARKGATEPVTPIRKNRADDFILRYMARADAVDKATTKNDALEDAASVTGLGGVSFGYGSVSLSDGELKAASRDIQNKFENGKTVLKTVLSFSEEYLKSRKIVDPNFEMTGRGSYKGQIDQLKLREAIMFGLERMGRRRFDDLRYVGVIQVDTEHVHCHLTMVDAGKGDLIQQGKYRGTQRGKLSARDKSFIRRGLDAYLDEHQKIAHLSSAIGYERKNVSTFVKKWAYTKMKDRSLPQTLIASLPKDRTLWRMGTNRKEMRKPNSIMRSMIEDVLSSEGSPMLAAMSKIRLYASERSKREGLSIAEEDRLIQNGRNKLIERSGNSVYQVLQNLSDQELVVRTPTLDIMSLDNDELAKVATKSEKDNEDSLVGFALRLRSYTSRIKKHKSEYDAAKQIVDDWQKLYEQNEAVPESQVLQQLFMEEEEYNRMCLAKYRYLLGPLGSSIYADANRFRDKSAPWAEDLAAVEEYQNAYTDLLHLSQDKMLRRLNDPQEAEARGFYIYGQSGGSLLVNSTGRQVLATRVDRLKAGFVSKLEALKEKFKPHGIKIQNLDDVLAGDPMVVDQVEDYSFVEVKSLDMHHMVYDSTFDREVGEHTFDRFVSRLALRRKYYDTACEYLKSTDQDISALDYIGDDISAGETVAKAVAKRMVLESKLRDLARRGKITERLATVSLDERINDEVYETFSHAFNDSDIEAFVNEVNEPSIE